jgi:hypothetical protein
MTETNNPQPNTSSMIDLDQMMTPQFDNKIDETLWNWSMVKGAEPGLYYKSFILNSNWLDLTGFKVFNVRLSE